MRLSPFQRSVLVQCLATSRHRLGRASLDRQYSIGQSKSLPARVRQATVTRLLERLIDRELAVGFGRRTPHKWFIDEVRLTRKGEQLARKLQGEQQVLPFKKKL